MISPMNENDLLAFLEYGKISYLYVTHPAVMTSSEAAGFVKDVPSVPGKKYFFLREKRRNRHILLITLGKKRVDLKRWGKQESLGKLNFADSDSLADILGVSSGAVGPLALINDSQHCIEVFIDCELWGEGYVQCHPLVNTASLVVTTSDLESFS